LFQQVHFANGLLLKAVSRTRNTFLRSAFLLFAAAQQLCLVETKHGYALKPQFLTADYINLYMQIISIEFEKKKR
jgi:hypothetical protein